MRSFMTSPAIINPTAEGTKDTLPGTDLPAAVFSFGGFTAGTGGSFE